MPQGEAQCTTLSRCPVELFLADCCKPDYQKCGSVPAAPKKNKKYHQPKYAKVHPLSVDTEQPKSVKCPVHLFLADEYKPTQTEVIEIGAGDASIWSMFASD